MKPRSDLDTLAREMQGRTPLGASALLFTILGVIVAAFIWALVTSIDDVTRAPGKVVPAGDVQVVQASEEGLIRQVFVAEGQEVAAGDPLVELDALVQTSQLDRETQRALALEARIARLSAEIEGREIAFPPRLDQDAPELAASERALHLGRAVELAAQVAVLDRQRQQRLQEEEVARIEIGTAERSLAIVTEERALLNPLVERGIEPRTTLLGLRQREEDLAGRIAGARAKLLGVGAALSEIDDTAAATKSRFRAEALADLADACKASRIAPCCARLCGALSTACTAEPWAARSVPARTWSRSSRWTTGSWSRPMCCHKTSPFSPKASPCASS